jgi:hypothetical protein
VELFVLDLYLFELTLRADVLNRFPSPTEEDLSHTVHVMKYIFPRQFGLHNVFTLSVDPREPAYPPKNYTYREEEIGWIEGQKSRHVQTSAAGQEGEIDQHKLSSRIPKRLRRKAVELVQNLQTGISAVHILSFSTIIVL